MLVCVQGLLVSTIIIGKHIPIFILIIIASFECRAWFLNLFLGFHLDNFHWVVIGKAVASSDKAPFLRYELVEILFFIDLLFATKSGHPEVESIHSPRHSVNKRRLILIDEAIDFICVFLDLFSLPYHVAVWIM